MFSVFTTILAAPIRYSWTDSFTAYFKNTPNSKSVWTAEPLRLVFFYLMPMVAPNEKQNFTKTQQVCFLDTKWHIIGWLHIHALLFVCFFVPAEQMCTVDNSAWCHKAQICGGFSQRPCSAFMTLCNAQCLHLFIVILHCADFMATAATCPVMFSTFSIPHPVARQNGGCRQPACGCGSFVSIFYTHSNLKECKIL